MRRHCSGLFRSAAIILVVVATLAAPAAAAPPTGKVSGYGFFWESGLAGYGGYQAWAADIDGDKVAELLIQAVQGEQEGGPPIAPRLAIYRRFSPIFEGPAPGIGVCGVADINADRRVEVLTANGLAYVWSPKDKALIASPDLAAPMERWLEANYLPAPDEGETIADFDGDGTLDVIERLPTGLGLVSKTKGEFALAFPAGAGEVGYFGDFWFPRLPGGETALFVDWTLWRTGLDGQYLTTSAAPSPAKRTSEYDVEPAVAFGDLDGDGVDELMTNDRGVILVYRWTGDMYEIACRSANNGGLGYDWFTTADLNGDGGRELVARLITPKLGSSVLKIYRLQAGSLEGLADVADAGAPVGGSAVAADLLGLGSDQLLFGRGFERCRASAVGLNVDLANLPAAKVGFLGKLSGAWEWAEHAAQAVLARPMLAVGVAGLGLCSLALVAVLVVGRANRRKKGSAA